MTSMLCARNPYSALVEPLKELLAGTLRVHGPLDEGNSCRLGEVDSSSVHATLADVWYLVLGEVAATLLNNVEVPRGSFRLHCKPA